MRAQARIDKEVNGNVKMTRGIDFKERLKSSDNDLRFSNLFSENPVRKSLSINQPNIRLTLKVEQRTEITYMQNNLPKMDV